MDKKKILVIEDDRIIAFEEKYNLEAAGYICDNAYDGEAGLNAALGGKYDLILLDIMLPKMDGFEVLGKLRQSSNVPVIMATARVEEKDKILGLETGADDYITKPFSFKELLSRINANIRRFSGEMISAKQQEAPSENIIKIRDLVIDMGRYSVRRGERDIDLTKKEYDLIAYLASNLSTPFSREELLDKVWGYGDYYGDIRTVDVTVSRLREKIEDDPAKPEYLLTKRGIGYYMA
jgi:two-component system response regulator VicR